MTDDLGDLRAEELREALSLLGVGDPSTLPAGRPGAARALRQALAEPGFVRSRMADAPPGAEEAFDRLVRSGPLSVEALLGRGWWGWGSLPAPLDWLQRRALLRVDAAGLVDATAAARRGWDERGWDDDQPVDGTRGEQPRLRLVTSEDPDQAPARERPVVVEAAGSVVIGEKPEDIDRAARVSAAGLRAIAPTVAISKLGKAALEDALRAGGVRLRGDEEVSVRSAAPALPGHAERAVTPWDIRAVFRRAIEEGRQVHLVYYPSSRGGAATERTVDPWTFADDLLVGWCHLRHGERSFALDRVGGATLLPSRIEHPRG